MAYRTILGLTNRMPVSKRDRFEPAGGQLADWLAEPASDKLQIGKGTTSELAEDEQPEDAPTTAGEAEADAEVTELTGSDAPSQTELPLGVALAPGTRPESLQLPDPHLLFSVVTEAAGELVDIDIDWSAAHVVAGLGFEDRALGAWSHLLAHTRPASATMVSYPDPGRSDEIRGLLNRASVPFSVVGATEIAALVSQGHLVERHAGPLVIDTTGLTKALIYGLVCRALLDRSEVWVLHTCAETYHPSDPELDEVMGLFGRLEFPQAFQRLDEIVAGEQGPFNTRVIGDKRWDTSQPSLLAAFVSLKHKRLTHLLEELPVEAIAAIAPVHTAGRESSRSVVARRLAESLVQVHGGKLLEVGSLDHDGAYLTLVDLHREYALTAGYNFELALSGSKMHAVGTAMFGSIATPSAVFYSAPARFQPDLFTKGTGPTRLIRLQRREGAA